MGYAHLRFSTFQDWLRLRPVFGLYKIARRYIIGGAYLLKGAPDPAALRRICRALGKRPLVLTISYNSVWMLKWQIRFGELYFSDVDRLIADNSSDPKAAREIEALCRDAGIAYLKLPFNRFSLGRPKDASLSHATALNWVWRHVIEAVHPPLVAILDHDLIPLHPVDFRAKIFDQPFFGPKMLGVNFGWQIWPGYAIFDGSIIERYRLDFWVHVRAGLDAGGANWQRVYRHFDANRLRFAAVPPHIIGRFDEWWHVGGASEYGVKPDGWRKEVEAVLQHEYEATSERSKVTPSIAT